MILIYFLNDFFIIFRCTGEIGTRDCSLTANGPSIIPPIISAKVNTKEKFSFKYGKVEVVAKLPVGNWIYPGLLSVQLILYKSIDVENLLLFILQKYCWNRKT